ncbi:MAG: type 2 isopentenyl-diphosphate Delta-isomerase [Nitrososphaerota archaeon]
MASEASQRKERDIRVVLEEGPEHEQSTLLECVHLLHNALPELNFDEVSTECAFLGHRFSAPLLVDSMTGGSQLSAKVNATIARVIERLGLGMGLGSQKVGLQHPELEESFRVAREQAPTAFIAANIGGAQLASGLTLEDVKRIIDMVRADALVVHLNPMQEALQVGGEPRYRGVLAALRELTKQLSVPVIVKEVGSGISPDVAVKLQVAGVKAINVAGAGGTSWTAAEAIKAEEQGEAERARLGRLFWSWGIPTAASLILVRRAVRLPLIASGGLRNGLEVAKCIALGASMAAMAKPALEQALKGEEALASFLEHVLRALKLAMFGVGAPTVQALAQAKYVITPPLSHWVMPLG